LFDDGRSTESGRPMRYRLIVAACGLAAMLFTSGAKAQGDERFYVYCDNGTRCIQAPCPSRSARDVQSGETLRGIRLDLSGLPESERKRSDLHDALYHHTLVLGGHKTTAQVDGSQVPALAIGRIIRASTKAERSHCSSGR
jgi:hypothetical protein